MEKDEKERICERALKFLGFHEDVKKDLDSVADVLM